MPNLKEKNVPHIWHVRRQHASPPNSTKNGRTTCIFSANVFFR